MRVACAEMHTLDVIGSALQWETERQNRLHQQAIEEKKKHAETDIPVSAAAPAEAAAASAPPDLVGRVPAIRSALIPVDEEEGGAPDGEIWSKPFALTKADFEPWTSFLAGYNQSRLFLQFTTSGTVVDAVVLRNPTHVDHAVRALLTLKKTPLRFILEPPVQINRQVEYQDFEADLRAASGKLRHDMMLKLARELHERQLAKAVEAGRLLGDELYEAMMGEGHVNLTRTWERVHGRKPTVDELHIMLSTGKVKPIPPSARPKMEGRVAAHKALVEDVPERALPAVPSKSLTPAPVPAPSRVQPAPPVLPDDDDDQADAYVMLGGAPVAPGGRPSSPASSKPEGAAPPGRRIAWYLLHAVAASSSVAALAWFWIG